MVQIILNILFLLSACLPALLFPPVRQNRLMWVMPGCALLCGVFTASALLLFIYALLLGACLWFLTYKLPEDGKLLSFVLCWGGCLAVLGGGHFLRGGAPASIMTWLFLALMICAALAFGFAINWCTRWTLEDSMPLSDERSISPLPLLFILAGILLLLTLLCGRFPLGCTVSAAVLQVFTLLITALWRDMSLAVRHSQETSDHSRQSMRVIDRASRSSEAELQRQLAESNNKLLLARLAYRNNDHASLAEVLDISEEQDAATYCSFPLLDAVLRHSAYEARRSGMTPNFQLQLGGLRDFSLSDIGVMLDMMLGVMTEHHPGKPDMLRLCVQEWGNALIMTVGRHDRLYSVDGDKLDTLNQLTAERGGWSEFAEKENWICLSAVLFRPSAEK